MNGSAYTEILHAAHRAREHEKAAVVKHIRRMADTLGTDGADDWVLRVVEGYFRSLAEGIEKGAHHHGT